MMIRSIKVSKDNRMIAAAIASLCMLLIPLHAMAQGDSTVSKKITTSSYMIGIGSTQILDTYLSQEHFSGTGLSFLYSNERQKPASRWMNIMEHQANISWTNNRSDDADEIEGAYAFYWGRYYSWAFCDKALTIRAGGMVNAEIGFIYNTLNGNNPAQARANINIMPSVIGHYRFNLLKLKMALRYELQLPLIGLMFSPNYGQSYYEIFSEGNYDHNIVPTTFISAPNIRQLITLDINISRRATLRLGYLGDYRQSSVNELKQHVYSHRFMIGYVRSFQMINYRP